MGASDHLKDLFMQIRMVNNKVIRPSLMLDSWEFSDNWAKKKRNPSWSRESSPTRMFFFPADHGTFPCTTLVVGLCKHVQL